MNFEFSGTAVTNYVGSSACVVIPDGVTAVYSGAFKNCAMADRIETVVIPSTVATVGSEAFMGCSALKTVRVVERGLTQIMYSTFRDCAALEHIDLPSSLQNAGLTRFFELYVPWENRSAGQYFRRDHGFRSGQQPECVGKVRDANRVVIPGP